MKKVSKIFCILMIILMFAFSFATRVNAADVINYVDDGEYEEIATPETKTGTDDAKKTTDESAKQNTTNTTDATNTTNPANQSTNAHAKAGKFETKGYIIAGAIAVVAVITGYVKYKKYNY